MIQPPFQSCPLPVPQESHILMSHGGGGSRTQQLLESIFLPAFQNPLLNQAHDGAIIEPAHQKLAFTTDSYVVQPLFFPGGDIGTLAICGTTNDLAMCGARPQWLSASFIIEEGLPTATLIKVVHSMKQAAQTVGIQIVTGDTKVVDKGKADQLFITTAGVGTIEHDVSILPTAIQPGDGILLSGDIGRHGMAIMSVREGLRFESPIKSDCASVANIVMALLNANIKVHCMRDLTRGGLASALNEISGSAQRQITIEESFIPVTDEVRGACELLGLDPLYVANEGTFIAFVAEHDIPRALDIMRSHPQAANASLIGQVDPEARSHVVLKGRMGPARMLNMLSGEQLPRIC